MSTDAPQGTLTGDRAGEHSSPFEPADETEETDASDGQERASGEMSLADFGGGSGDQTTLTGHAADK